MAGLPLLREYAEDVQRVGGHASSTRHNRQIERGLKEEWIRKLDGLRLRAIVIPIPNDFYIPARSEQERQIANILVHRLKSQGFLKPGVGDLVILWSYGCGLIEAKRPQGKRLFETIPKGRLSKSQRNFRDECAAVGVRYEVCESWAQVLDVLLKWRVPAF